MADYFNNIEEGISTYLQELGKPCYILLSLTENELPVIPKGGGFFIARGDDNEIGNTRIGGEKSLSHSTLDIYITYFLSEYNNIDSSDLASEISTLKLDVKKKLIGKVVSVPDEEYTPLKLQGIESATFDDNNILAVKFSFNTDCFTYGE